MKNINEQLKDAIACSDFSFLEKNKHKYDLNHRFLDENNDSLLLYSISDKDSSAYQYFLKNNADINLVNNENENIFHAIVYSNCKNRISEVINKNKTIIDKINDRDLNGATPLLLSISLEYFEIAKQLIKNGADVNICDNERVFPIHIAAQFAKLDFMKLLIKKGAYLNVKTIKGNYPLALAINNDNDENVRYLFRKIYKLNCR